MLPHSAQMLNILDHPCEILTADFNKSSFDRHFHETFSIGLVTSGMNAFSYRGRHIEVPAGAICIADPGEVHDGGLAGCPWSYINIFVPIGLFHTLLLELDGQRQVAFQTGGIKDKLSRLHLARLFKAALAAGTDKAKIDELAILAFGHLLRHYLVDRPQITQAIKGSIANRAIEVMRDCAGKEVSLALLSAETGVSRYAVIRAVSASTGITPVAYMTQLRIHRAKQLIRDGVPIAGAAIEAGFSDQSHLTRAMKRLTGITPGKIKPQT